MPDIVQRPQIAEAIARYLGLKGRPKFELSHALGIHFGIDIADVPYFKQFGYQLAGLNGPAAVAAEFGHVWIVPVPTTILQVEKIIINNTAAAAHGYHVGWCTNAQFNSIGVDSDADPINLSAGRASERVGGVRVRAGTHTADLVSNFTTLQVAAASDRELEFPHQGVVMDGTEAGGGLTIACVDANTAFTVNFFGRAWPVSG